MEPQFSYEIEKTADGSPTIKLWKPNQEAEWMHHSEGALSESIYIYYEALLQAYRHGMPLRVLSIGTGLGYNEMLTAAFTLKHEIAPGGFQISTYESEDYIRSNFMAWLKNEFSPWTHLYNEVCAQVAAKFELENENIRQQLKNIEVCKSLNSQTEFSHKFSVIFFDYFSSKATPDEWQEEAIENFLEKATAEKCVLSTYAAKGTLKRALKKSGFQIQLRPGFSGKRQCTLAIKI